MSRDMPLEEQETYQCSTPETGSGVGASPPDPGHSLLKRKEEGLLANQEVKETKVGKANKDK